MGRVINTVPDGRRTRPKYEGQVERAVGRLEIAPHVQRRHALVDRDRVEPTRVDLRGEHLAHVLRDCFVEEQQILDRVPVFESREPTQRRALLAAGCEVRVHERALQRAERGLDDRRVWFRCSGGRHLALLEPIVDLLPRLERLMVGEVEPEAREVQGRDRSVAVTGETRRLDERRDVRLERLGGSYARDEPDRYEREQRAPRSTASETDVTA